MRFEPSPDPGSVVEQYGPMVTSLCRSFFYNEEEARDACQEAWMAVLGSLKDFRGESRLETWLYSVVFRRLLRFKNEERRHSLRHLRVDYHAAEFEAPTSARPDLDYWVMETCRNCMKGVLFCLEPEARLVFLFRFVSELSYPQIADIMEKSEASVRQTASRARRKVGRFLSGDCGLTRAGAQCRCGNHRWITRIDLQTRFAQMGRLVQQAELYRSAQRVFPKRDYWENLSEG
jgi:RNA polymerase sigma-70 factor (ECF subfamily)